MTRGRAALFSFTLLSILIATAAADFVANGRNTLARKPHLTSVKTLMGRGLMGSRSFVATRNALANESLDLGVWHGGQEVVFGEPLSPAVIRGRVRLADRVWSTLEFDRGAVGYSGVRFSRHGQLPTQGFTADREGRFVERFPLAFGALSAGWHDFEVDLDEAVRVRIDGVEIGRWKRAGSAPGLVGFRAGLLGSSEFDDLVVLDRDGTLIASESFDNRPEFLLSFGLLLMVLLPLSVWLSRFRNVVPPLAFAILVAAGVVSVAVFDRVYWAKRYPYVEMGRFRTSVSQPLAAHQEVVGLAEFAERMRARILSAYPVPLGSLQGAETNPGLTPEVRRWLTRSNPQGDEEPVLLPYRTSLAPRDQPARRTLAAPLPAPDGRFRVVWIGTSQTWGAGAETPTDTFVARVHSRLTEAFGAARIESLNLSIPGTHSTVLSEGLPGEFEWLRPNLVLVNLGNNDRSSETLLANVERIVVEARRHGGAAALILEVNVERVSQRLLEAHAGFRALGTRIGVPVLDLHGHFQSPDVRDSGFLAWDVVHLSSLGQEIAADFLFSEMEPLVRERLATRPEALKDQD